MTKILFLPLVTAIKKKQNNKKKQATKIQGLHQ